MNTLEFGRDLNVSGVWKQGITGKGSVVAILDDGLDFEHEDLQNNYVRYIKIEVTFVLIIVQKSMQRVPMTLMIMFSNLGQDSATTCTEPGVQVK